MSEHVYKRQGSGDEAVLIRCRTCKGSGTLDGVTECGDCRGYGRRLGERWEAAVAEFEALADAFTPPDPFSRKA